MMGSNGQTSIKYTDTALPTTGAAVTLFNSVTAFPPGGSFHLLGLQWFQWMTRHTSTGGTGTAVITGAFSNDSGATFVTFYTSPVSIVDTTTFKDEVYIGMYKDVRFQLQMSTNNTLTFLTNLSLNPHKPASIRTAGDVLI
jgi:hypothetical protein